MPLTIGVLTPIISDMGKTLREEIQQERPFKSLEEEAALNLYRTVQMLVDTTMVLLRPHHLTPPQYNVLRILRGAGSSGLGRNEIRDRLIGRMPDVTRLLDNMEASGLVRRDRSTTDRRCVPAVLTEKGNSLLDELDAPLAELQRKHFGHLTPGQLYSLIETLTLIRSHLEGQ